MSVGQDAVELIDFSLASGIRIATSKAGGKQCFVNEACICHSDCTKKILE